MIFERQLLHLLLLLGLLAGLALASELSGFWEGELWGIRTVTWVIFAVAAPIMHQTQVWLCWRLQLHGRVLTNYFGNRGFTVHAVLFAIFGLSRILTILLLAISNRGTLEANPNLLNSMALVLTLIAAYLFYCVHRYFGFRRALGADHFDEAYRTKPFVGEGIFRFTPNAMYVTGFSLFWIPGFALGSVASLAVAAFCHLYIWVHFLCTEKPDMRWIYGGPPRG